MVRRSQAVSEAYHAWIKAREANDFGVYKDALKKIVDFCKKTAELIGYEDHPYDALLDMYVLDTAQSHNLLTIYEYDPNNLEIKGAFSTTLILSLRGSDERDPPGKVVFSQGEFTAKVEPGWFD